jgi:nitrate reductase gamma subunit
MKNTKDIPVIVHSILWAAAIMGSAIVLRGTEYAEKINFLLVVLWFGSFMTLQVSRESLQAEWKCIRKFLRLIPRTE